MSDLLNHTYMDGLPVEKQAERAVAYTLCRIRDDSYVGYFMGPGAQAFSLLTKAYAAMTSKPVSEIRQDFACRDPRNPRHDD